MDRPSTGALMNAVSPNVWLPIETAPKDSTFVLLAGPSGYITTPLRVEVCRYLTAYGDWYNHAGDAFTDGGEKATHWLPLPLLDVYIDEWYEIVGHYTKCVIGVCCGGKGLSDVLSEEPNATFNRITKEAFDAYGDDPWVTPGEHGLS